jgi:hypothetical protein
LSTTHIKYQVEAIHLENFHEGFYSFEISTTRLGEFSLFGSLFTLGSFINLKSSISATIFHSKSYEIIVRKKAVGLHFWRFFTNSSGHPV